MKKRLFITKTILSAPLLCLAVQSCRSLRTIREVAKVAAETQRITIENKKYLHLWFWDIPIAGNAIKFSDKDSLTVSTRPTTNYPEYHKFNRYNTRIK
ncbi:MAG: hypothetical protein E7108_00225 [Bacteroidales bacterium]|jgi:hypothetical protein|nr:hypothetical protein [Bacteroidales bacterium]